MSANTGGLHLCLATRSYHPFYSGAAERFRRYIPGFQARGIQVSIFTGTPTRERAATADDGSPSWESVSVNGLLPTEVVDGVPVHRMRLPLAGGLRRAYLFAQGLARYCWTSPSPPNVVQIFHPALAALPGHARIRRMSIPIIATQTMMFELPDSAWRRYIRRLATRTAFGPVTCAVVGTNAMLHALQDVPIRPPLELIPHGVDATRFRPPATLQERLQVRRRLRIPPDATVLLFVGSPTPRKGLARLLDAWSQLASQRADLHLIVAGVRRKNISDCQTSYERRIEMLASTCNGRGRLHFTGRVPDIDTYMRSADLFVLPSTREGMPNVVAEAMASGIPVVMAPFSGLSDEFGKPGTHYALTSFQSDALAADISMVLDAPQFRTEMAHRAREWALQHLDVTFSIDRYADIYRRVATRVSTR